MNLHTGCGAQEWRQEREEQFRFTYNEVSMYTDMRLRDDPYTEPLDQSHDEIMAGILRGRPAQTVPVSAYAQVNEVLESLKTCMALPAPGLGGVAWRSARDWHVL